MKLWNFFVKPFFRNALSILITISASWGAAISLLVCSMLIHTLGIPETFQKLILDFSILKIIIFDGFCVQLIFHIFYIINKILSMCVFLISWNAHLGEKIEDIWTILKVHICDRYGKGFVWFREMLVWKMFVEGIVHSRNCPLGKCFWGTLHQENVFKELPFREMSLEESPSGNCPGANSSHQRSFTWQNQARTFVLLLWPCY